MADYAKDLFSGSMGLESPEKSSRDYAKELFFAAQAAPAENPVGGTFSPTGEISTITAKPMTKYVEMKQPEASFGSLLKSGFVDDPFIKAKIFSESRGIPISRYRVNKTGQVEFKDEEGNWQREVSEKPLSKVRAGAAEVVGHPSTYLAPAGAVTLGPMGAAGGGMIGEAGRKAVGKYVYGEQPGTLKTLGDIAMQGILALGGEMAGKVFSGGVNRYMSRGTGILKKAGVEAGPAPASTSGVSAVLSPEDHAKALWIQKLAEQYDIQLAPHQLYDKQGMTNMWKYLRGHPLTSDKVRVFEDNLARKSEKAIQEFIENMGGYQQTPSQIGQGLKDTSEKVIRGAEKARTDAVSPLYEKAYDLAEPVDLVPALKNLDRLIESYPDSSVKGGLLGLKKQLTTRAEAGARPELAAGHSGSQAMVTAGEAGSEKALMRVPESDLRKIQKTLFDLNDLIEGTSYDASKIAPSNKKVLNRELEIIKKDILDAVERASPEFIQANRVYESLSPPIEKLKKSVIGELTRMQSEKEIAKAPHKLMDVANMPDAQLVREAKKEIEGKDPVLWMRMVGGYIRDVFEGLKVTEEGKVVNAVGKLQKKLYGTGKQREIMEAAMGPQEFESFKDLMTIFQRAAIGTGKESMTAPLLAIEKQISGQLGSKGYELVSHPKTAITDWTFGKFNDIMLRNRQGELVEALTSANVVERMSKLKKLTPGSQKLIEGVGVLSAEIIDRMRGEAP